MKLTIITPLDAQINALPETLGEIKNFDVLRQISIDLGKVYEKHCFNFTLNGARNNGLLLALMVAVNTENKAFKLRREVNYSIASRVCKLAVCEVFLNNINRVKLLER